MKEHGFERKAFADPLKRSVAALFDIPFSEIDKLKNDPATSVRLYNNDGKIAFMDFRELLQRYGTEAHRDVFGNCFWVDMALPVQGFYPGRAIVVTDVRFREEAERIKYLGGRVVIINRKDAALVSKDPHRSELIDFPELIDHKIYNDGTHEELYAQVEDILAKTPLESVC